MNTIRKWFVCAVLIVISLSARGDGVEWLTDVPTALEKARRENKIVALDFTGSDWCGWCQRLKREVFDQPEFAAFANENLVMVELDFPQHKEQSPELQAANRELANRFQIKGFPTLVYLNAAGQQVAIGGYIAGGAKNFIAKTEKIPGIRHVDGTTPQTPAQEAEEPRRPPPKFVPIAPTTPTVYMELALKGISGSKERRMALINNETLMAGETAKIKLLNSRVEVCCKEIRDDSVLVIVDGKTMELKLGQHQKKSPGAAP
jgi:thioredoxin-related protein